MDSFLYITPFVHSLPNTERNKPHHALHHCRFVSLESSSALQKGKKAKECLRNIAWDFSFRHFPTTSVLKTAPRPSLNSIFRSIHHTLNKQQHHHNEATRNALSQPYQSPTTQETIFRFEPFDWILTLPDLCGMTQSIPSQLVDREQLDRLP